MKLPTLGRVTIGLLLVAALAAPVPAFAQDKPRYGGELTSSVPSEPPSYDAHREETFGLIHPSRRTTTRCSRVGSLRQDRHQAGGRSRRVLDDLQGHAHATRSSSAQGVKFHDGSEMTSKDVKASYDQIIFPPAGVESLRKGSYASVEVGRGAGSAHGALPPQVAGVVPAPEPGLALELDLQGRHPRQGPALVRDAHQGTGPFKFVEHVKGSHWVGKKNPNYWDKGKPYLDGYRAIFMTSSSAQVAAIRGERAHVAVPRLQPARSVTARAGPRQQDHGAGEPLGLPELRRHAPREEALRRQARAAGAHPRPRPLRGLQGAVQDHPGQGRGRHPGAGHALRHAARRAREARRLRPRHRGQPGRGQASAARGGRPRRLLVHVQEPRHPHALRADRHLAHRPVAADRPQREAGDDGGGRLLRMLKGGDFEVAMDFQCGFIVEPDLDICKFQSARSRTPTTASTRTR